MDTTYTQDELRNFFAWQLEQMNPMLHRKNKECWPNATVDTLMANPISVRNAIQTMDRAERRIQAAKAAGVLTEQVAPWEDPLWREKQAAAEKAEADRLAEQSKQPSPFVIGGSA